MTDDDDGVPPPACIGEHAVPPIRLNHQNATGTTESRSRSEASHCTTNRAVNSAWPRNPTSSQKVNLGMADAPPRLIRAA